MQKRQCKTRCFSCTSLCTSQYVFASIDAVEKLMNGRKADMVFTDPPYGINMQRSGSIKGDASMGDAERIIAGAISTASIVSKQGASWYFWVDLGHMRLLTQKYQNTERCLTALYGKNLQLEWVREVTGSNMNYVFLLVKLKAVAFQMFGNLIGIHHHYIQQ